MQYPIECRVLTGPTGSGKTELALRMAEEMDWEIICMDSMQIYRGMDIGTAKPSDRQRSLIRHHMIDICDPADSYSVSEYRDEARKTAEKLHKSGKGFLFVGGTGLYLHALMYPMQMGGIPANPSLREELKKIATTDDGKKKLHSRLREMDPATADRLPVNDVRRIIRAIEVTLGTGIPYSQQSVPPSGDNCYSWKVVATRPERERLYGRINDRVDRMISEGLQKEVETLLQKGVPETAQSMSGIGYKEMIPCIRGWCTREEAAERIKLATRHYAKRQITFLKRETAVRYFDPEAPDAYDFIRRELT